MYVRKLCADFSFTQQIPANSASIGDAVTLSGYLLNMRQSRCRLECWRGMGGGLAVRTAYDT